MFVNYVEYNMYFFSFYSSNPIYVSDRYHNKIKSNMYSLVDNNTFSMVKYSSIWNSPNIMTNTFKRAEIGLLNAGTIGKSM